MPPQPTHEDGVNSSTAWLMMLSFVIHQAMQEFLLVFSNHQMVQKFWLVKIKLQNFSSHPGMVGREAIQLAKQQAAIVFLPCLWLDDGKSFFDTMRLKSIVIHIALFIGVLILQLFNYRLINLPRLPKQTWYTGCFF